MFGKEPPIFTHSFIGVTIINFLIFFSFQMIFPTLPLYVHELGGTDSIIGFVMGIFTVTSLVARPFSGLALDKIGRCKVFIFGLFVLCISSFSYYFASVISVIVVIRLVNGIGWGVSGTSNATIAASMLPKKRLAEGIGYFTLSNSLSMAIAPASGLYIADHFGFHKMILLSGILVVIAIVVSFVIKYPSYHPQTTDKHQSLYDFQALGPTFLLFCTSATFSSIASFLPLFAAEQGVADIGWFFTVYAVAIFLSRLLTGRIVDQKGYAVALIPGLSSMIIALFLISQSHNLFMFLIPAFLYGLGFGACQMTLQTMVVKKVPSDKLGAANATFFSGMDLGNGLGALTLGTLAEIVGYSKMFMAASATVGVALLIYVFYLRKKPAYAS